MTLRLRYLTHALLGISLVFASLWAGFLVPDIGYLNAVASTQEPRGLIRDDSFEIGSGLNNVVYVTTQQSDGKILLGGWFTTYNGQGANRITRLNSDGSIDESFDTGSGFDSSVWTIIEQSDGKILVGGNFTTYNGKSANRIIRLNSDGSRDESFDTGTGFQDEVEYSTGWVRSMQIQPDGKILVGGKFSHYNEAPSKILVRLNSDGTKDTTFNPVLNSDFNRVDTIERQSDGSILIAGRTYQERILFERIDEFGNGDSSFTKDPELYIGAVWSVVSQPDGKILVGGNFNNDSFNQIKYLVRLNTDGSIDSSFQNYGGLNGQVWTIHLQQDEKVVVAGEFSEYKGVSANKIIRLNEDGGRDESLDVGEGFNNGVWTVTEELDGTLLVGGGFTEYQGESVNRIIRLEEGEVEDPSEYPIILLHGIMGGWNPELFGIEGMTSVDYTFLGLGVQGPSFGYGNDWYTLPEGNDPTWSHFVRSLDNLGLQRGYVFDSTSEGEVEDKDYFVFFYDWRDPVSVNSDGLKRYIQQVKQGTNSSKVNVVAHSMGGLVTRGYINQMGDSEYQEDISHFVMAGTPNQGAAGSVALWYGGDINLALNSNLDANLFMRWYLKVLSGESGSLNNAQRREVIQNQIPSVKDLLPIDRSIWINDGSITSPWQTIDNQFLTQMNNHENSNPLQDKVNLLAIAGLDENTLKNVTLTSNLNLAAAQGGQWSFTKDNVEYIHIDDTYSLEGDGTVMKNSLSNGGKYPVHTLNYTEHMEVIQNDVNTIFDFLQIDRKGTDYNALIGNTEFSDKTLAFEVDSPVFLEVTLPDGTVLDENTSDEVFQDNDAFYISLGDQEKKALFVSTDQEGEYTITLDPNGDGEYVVSSRVLNRETGDLIETTQTGVVTKDDLNRSYTVTIEQDESGEFVEEAFELERVNTPPIPLLDKELYEGVEGDTLTFDASESSDLERDALKYKWYIEGEIETGYSESPVLEHIFQTPYEGEVLFTVTDGEFEKSTTADVLIQEQSFDEKIFGIRTLLESLEEDGTFIRSKKLFWLNLISLVELDQIQNNASFQTMIIRTLVQDIQGTLNIYEQQIEMLGSQRFFWWNKPQILISEDNVEILQSILGQIQKL